MNKEEESNHDSGNGKDGSSRAVNGAFGLNSNGNGTKGGGADKKRKAGEWAFLAFFFFFPGWLGWRHWTLESYSAGVYVALIRATYRRIR